MREAVVMTSELQAEGNFKDRLDAVFAALDSSSSCPSGAKGWSLSETQVFRPGKGLDYSSEEEEEALKEEKAREELYPTVLLDLYDDEGNGAIERPSRAFCKAIDNEQELDSNDLLANGATHPIADAEQPFRTQVLDSNIFETANRPKESLTLPSIEQAIQSSSKDDNASKHSSVAEASVRLGAHDATSGRMAGSPSRPPLPTKFGRGSGRRSGSFVPDHVKHPERYTAYVLDEPIVVGSGDLGSVDEVPRHTDVVMEDSNQEDIKGETVPLLQFGTGITFQRQRGTSQASVRAENTLTSRQAENLARANLVEDALFEEPDSQVLTASEDSSKGLERPTTEFEAKPRRQRNLRSRS